MRHRFRHGFSYVEMLAVCGIFLLIVTLTHSIVFPLFRTTHKITTQLHRQTLIVQVLDALDQDLAFADQVQVAEAEITVLNADEAYRYTVKNNRLCRIKNGVLYLTPKDLLITDWQVSAVPLAYSCFIDGQLYERTIRRRN